ncbi:MAG: peptidylprolyl isomerase [Holosporales bacterium]|nr:peptidylprolyl isomerase [Holosporales bacterium]
MSVPLVVLLVGVGNTTEVPSPPPPTEARIIAVVNGGIITETDIEARLSLLIASSGTHPPQEMLPQMRRAILQTLIEEHLKIQEARRIARLIKRPNYISEADIQRMLAVMIQRSGLSPALFEGFLKAHHISRATILQQARAHVSWSKVIADLYGESVQVSDKETERLLAQFFENQRRGALLVSRIVLPFDSPQQEKAALAEMGRIHALLQQGANFSVLAQQFSKAPEAFKGGNLGWVVEETFSPVEQKALKSLKVGQFSPPLLRRDACVILLCQDRRLPGATTVQEVTIQRFFIPAPYALDSEEKAQVFIAQAYEVREYWQQEGKDPQKLEAMFPGLKVTPKETLLGEDIDTPLRNLLNSVSTGEISQPILTPDGVLLIVVQKRQERPIMPPTKEALLDQIRETQLGNLAERYLRQLKCAAYLEIRG